MKRVVKCLVQTLLCVWISQQAWGGWKLTGSDEKVKIYLNTGTFAVMGDKAMIWSLVDYTEQKLIGGINVSSVIEIIEVDCKNKLMNLKGIAYYHTHMAQGKTFNTFFYSDKKWFEPEYQIDRIQHEAVCADQRMGGPSRYLMEG